MGCGAAWRHRAAGILHFCSPFVLCLAATYNIYQVPVSRANNEAIGGKLVIFHVMGLDGSPFSDTYRCYEYEVTAVLPKPAYGSDRCWVLLIRCCATQDSYFCRLIRPA